jgi:hypothetical protein
MILLEPAYTITHLMVEIKRRTISLTEFSPSSTHRAFWPGELAQNATSQAQQHNFRVARYPPGTLEPLLKCEPKDLSEEEFYSIRRVIIGSRRDTRHAGRAQARMATASSPEVTMR